ncbi:aspartate-alanine antiporter [Pseudomonas sp. PDNC002]|uniref:aspartate-alanine antiporter n=1 Tax=Pseudomonas sp. PDNC002 TaxID=2811422 RepID=UPI001963070E|nr:aspartate-alanine antiporter [Pseudomonas sp. PDNC002]QRY77451.1 aspartate-alanine antiporter [Pseudomonas sp. PDNC002]
MLTWIEQTLRSYPELAIFLSIGIGYWVGGKNFKGFTLGAVTATLLAALLVGQVGISISPTVKSVFFLMFLFAIGYGVGPQFVRGIAKDGLPQAVFAVVVCVLCLASAIAVAWVAKFDLGSAIGLFAGSQTISASMGLATDAINRLGLAPDKTQALLNAMPVAYAVTYIFGTIGSAVVLALVGPKLLGIDLAKACKDYELELGAGADRSGEGSVWHRYVLRAYRVAEGGVAVGKSVAEAEALAHGKRLFIERLRRNGELRDALPDEVIQVGDVLAIGGHSDDILQLLGHFQNEVEDDELLDVPIAGIDVYVSNPAVAGKTLEELAQRPRAHGVYLRRIRRGAVSTEIPVLPRTVLQHGDVITLTGLTKDVQIAARELGQADTPSNMADVAFIGAAIFIGGLIGAVVLKVGGVPLTLSTAGGALISGIVFGWLRSIRPTFGRIPEPTVWFMNSVGLNVFIAVVGIDAAAGFVSGLRTLGVSLFLWGMLATTLPLILSLLIGRYVFRFHPAILFGAVAGSRTTTAALGMICEAAKSNVPALGYTVTYAVGNTLLTIWGMVAVLILS